MEYISIPSLSIVTEHEEEKLYAASRRILHPPPEAIRGMNRLQVRQHTTSLLNGGHALCKGARSTVDCSSAY